MDKLLVKFRSAIRQYLQRFLRRNVHCYPCARTVAESENKIAHLYRNTNHVKLSNGQACSSTQRRRPDDIDTLRCFCGDTFDVRTIVLESRFLAHVYSCLFQKMLTKSLMSQYNRLNEQQTSTVDVGQRTTTTTTNIPVLLSSSPSETLAPRAASPPLCSAELRQEYTSRWASDREKLTYDADAGHNTFFSSNEPATSRPYACPTTDKLPSRTAKKRTKTVTERAIKSRTVAINRMIVNYAAHEGFAIHANDRGRIVQCRICDKRVFPTNLLVHGKEHAPNGREDDATSCPLCGRHLFYVNTELLRAQLYHHTLTCLHQTASSDHRQPMDPVHHERFVELASRHGLLYVAELRQRFHDEFVRDRTDADQPDWERYCRYAIEQTNRYVDQESRTWPNMGYESEDPVQRIESDLAFLARDSCSRAIERMLTEADDANAQNLQASNDYVCDDNVTYVNVNNCDVSQVFHCRPEIDRLRAVCRLDRVRIGSTCSPLLDTFLTNEQMEEAFGTAPDWLLSILQPVYRQQTDDHLDRDLCGLSVWMLALAQLLPSGELGQPEVANCFSFAHIFLYKRAAKHAFNVLSDSSKYYVLPNTCLCYDADRPIDSPDNLHRHLICLFASRSARSSYLNRVSSRRLPQGTNGSTKTQYCLSIRTKHHYFNALHYVSRQKIDTRGAANLHNVVLDLAADNHRTDKSGIVSLPQIFDRLSRVGTKDNELLPLTVRASGSNTTNLEVFVRRATTCSEQSNDGHVAPEKDKEDTVNEGNEDGENEDKDSLLTRHAQNGVHVYIKEPVCSHFIDLVSIAHPTGLTELLSKKLLTPNLALAMALKSRPLVRASGQINIELSTIRFDRIRGLIGCNLHNHVLPYRNLTTLEPTDLIRVNGYLRSLGMAINGEQVAEGKRIVLFANFDECEVVLPPVAAARTVFLQKVFSSLLKDAAVSRANQARASQIIQVQRALIERLLDLLAGTLAETGNNIE